MTPPGPARLLIVEDDAKLASVVAMIARELYPREQDLAIETAGSVKAARAILLRLPDAGDRAMVLSDHHLPPSATTGLDLLQEVGQALPAAMRVLMTGRDPGDLQPALGEARLDAFLAKPFTFHDVQPLLRRLVEGAATSAPVRAPPAPALRTPLE